MERVDRKTGEVDGCNVPFATKAEVVLESTDVAELYDNAIDKIAESIANGEEAIGNLLQM